MVETLDIINYKVFNEGLFKLLLYPHTHKKKESHLYNSTPDAIQMECMATSFQNTDQGHL